MTTFTTPKIRLHGVNAAMQYLHLTREQVVEKLTDLEARHETMPEEVAALFDAGREWEALRLWRDMLGIDHRPKKKYPELKPSKAESAKLVHVQRVANMTAALHRICAKYGIEREIVVSSARGPIAKVRRVIAYYFREVYGGTYPEIAYVLRGSSMRNSTITDMVLTFDAKKDQRVSVKVDGIYRARTAEEFFQMMSNDGI